MTKKLLINIAMIFLAMIVFGTLLKIVGDKYGGSKDCYSKKYKVDLCFPVNNAYRPVSVERVMPEEEFEFIAENEEFRRAGGFRAIIVRSKQSKINHLALLPEYSRIDFSKKDTYRMYLYHVQYWRNMSQVDQFLIAEVVKFK